MYRNNSIVIIILMKLLLTNIKTTIYDAGEGGGAHSRIYRIYNIYDMYNMKEVCMERRVKNYFFFTLDIEGRICCDVGEK